LADRSFTALLDSLVFPECPRWHDGRLWFSDVHDRRVYAMTADGQPEVIAQSEDALGLTLAAGTRVGP